MQLMSATEFCLLLLMSLPTPPPPKIKFPKLLIQITLDPDLKNTTQKRRFGPSKKKN
jgi:hypothetical protein